MPNFRLLVGECADERRLSSTRPTDDQEYAVEEAVAAASRSVVGHHRARGGVARYSPGFRK